MLIQPFFYGLHCNFCRLILRKTEHPCGNAAEHDIIQAAGSSQIQTRCIAGGEKLPVVPSDRPADNQTDSCSTYLAGRLNPGVLLALPAGSSRPCLRIISKQASLSSTPAIV